MSNDPLQHGFVSLSIRQRTISTIQYVTYSHIVFEISDMADPPMLLFICTGNYYRSRYAELYFNARVSQSGGWHAKSRGLQLSSANIGPIAPCVLDQLVLQGFALRSFIRTPLPLTDDDLAQADRIIALDVVEHRPYIETLFPTWQDRLIYWHIADIDRMPTSEAFCAIEAAIDTLIHDLRSSG
jgi:protein-tyrosine phosphatase